MSHGKNPDAAILHDDVELSDETEEKLLRYEQSVRPQQLVPFQPSLKSAEQGERRIVDRRHAERRIERVESPPPTAQWREEIQRGFNATTDDTLRVLFGALLHLQQEVAQLRTEVALKHGEG